MSPNWLQKIFNRRPELNAATAYDQWAGFYDDQPGNLMMDLDESIFSELLNAVSLAGKTVVDIGCGTGRHWKKIMAGNPSRLVGFDVSKKMLEQLTHKFPTAEVYLSDGTFNELKNETADLLVSTLTIAHIENLDTTFSEWNRILKPGGDMIITDYHPDALAHGAKRTFSHESKTVVIKNHVHSTSKIRLLAKQLGYKEMRFVERNIDETVKTYYEQQDALEVFERFKNTPIIYGIHLKKGHGPS